MKDKIKKGRGKRIFIGFLVLIIIPSILGLLTKWYYGMSLFGLVFLYKIIKVRKRGFFAKDVEGREVKTKQFFKRWKKGIEGITPLQQSITNLVGNWIVLSGILGGMIINALVRMENQWIWIEVILGGSLILVVMQLIGGIQKYWRFKEINKLQKDLEKQTEENNKKDDEKVAEEITEEITKPALVFDEVGEIDEEKTKELNEVLK